MALKVKAKRQKLVFNGHGLGDTKWKGCAWKELLVTLVILTVRYMSYTVRKFLHLF